MPNRLVTIDEMRETVREIVAVAAKDLTKDDADVVEAAALQWLGIEPRALPDA